MRSVKDLRRGKGNKDEAEQKKKTPPPPGGCAPNRGGQEQGAWQRCEGWARGQTPFTRLGGVNWIFRLRSCPHLARTAVEPHGGDLREGQGVVERW